MDSAFGQTQYYSSFAADKALGRTQFVVKHYAGDVAYTIDGFLDANNDLLYRDLKVAMLSATNIVINATFDKAQLESMKRPATAGTQFRKNMNDLMDILMAKTPSYVRCIKPNGEKKVSRKKSPKNRLNCKNDARAHAYLLPRVVRLDTYAKVTK